MTVHYRLLPGFCLLLITGCSNAPAHRSFYQENALQAAALIEKGYPKQAAKLYRALSQTDPRHRDRFNLLTADALFQSGDNKAAEEIIHSINTTALSIAERNRLNLIEAQIKLSNGQAEQALSLLQLTQPYALKITEQVSFYQSLAFAYSLTGDLLQSVRARIQLDEVLATPEQRHDNNQAILSTLKSLPIQSLILEQPSAPDVLGGWMALARILKTAQTAPGQQNFQANLAEWQRLFPQHPANSEFLQTQLTKPHSFSGMPTALAIFLPQSGHFANAAEVIKQGFLMAYQQTETDFHPTLRFYDTSASTPSQLYQQAISEGAELIIGPLDKANIQALAENTVLTIPVLALNHVSTLSRENLFQFGLSPIDDVVSLVNQANQAEIDKALLLVPDSHQGRRIADYLTEAWQQMGHTLLETQYYPLKTNDFSSPIKKLLNLDESHRRYRRLRNLLARNIVFTERRRQDAEAMFISASPRIARSLYPQIRFQRASHLPVYATSQVYSGHPNVKFDEDLNRITFCDIPWLFADFQPESLSMPALQESWKNIPNRYLRLLALGLDSFNLIPHLSTLEQQPYQAATGLLSINQQQRITRQLSCAKFIDGVPSVQDTPNEIILDN